MYWGVWIDLSPEEKAQLVKAGGGYLIETNEATFTVKDCNGVVVDEKGGKDQRRWFLFYYIVENGELKLHHFSQGVPDKQYAQIVNWQWSGASGYGLDKIKGKSQGSVVVKSTFELYPYGSNVAHEDRFHWKDDKAERRRTYQEAASRIKGEVIDEVGYIALTFPWRMGATRSKSRSVLTFRASWVSCPCTDSASIKTDVDGKEIEGGINRPEFKSDKYGDRPMRTL
jgi:hypothetical protein